MAKWRKRLTKQELIAAIIRLQQKLDAEKTMTETYKNMIKDQIERYNYQIVNNLK